VRSQHALKIVTQQPGIAIPDIAKKMGISQNYLYRVLPALEADGKVRKQDRGWSPVA
jgi:DNA-binding IscR family transcriptional regulator